MPIHIGLVGKNGAGKSAVCGYLKSKGFIVRSLSDIVREVATQKGRTHSRDNLVQTANELKAAQGSGVLAIQSLAAVRTQLATHDIAFDSIRHPEEARILTENGFRLIGIDAPIELRYERISSRAKGTDQVDFDTFKAHDERENSGSSSGQNINETLRYCVAVIQNDRDLLTLHERLDTVVFGRVSTAG